MFPDIPAYALDFLLAGFLSINHDCRDNIRYDLLRTGSVQETSNKILERGFLPAVCHQHRVLVYRA